MSVRELATKKFLTKRRSCLDPPRMHALSIAASILLTACTFNFPPIPTYERDASVSHHDDASAELPDADVPDAGMPDADVRDADVSDASVRDAASIEAPDTGVAVAEDGGVDRPVVPPEHCDDEDLPPGAHLIGAAWPRGTIPVCWSGASMERSDFTTLSMHVQNAVNASWPRVAGIEFTGWDSCPHDTGGMLVINLNDDDLAHATLGYEGSASTHTLDLGVARGDFFRSLIAHEVGHVLGFGHEKCRSDAASEAASACREAGDTDSLAVSIMASTGYCQQYPILNRWDLAGARQAYGHRSDNVISTGSQLFVRKINTGDIYERTGDGWKRVGGPGGQFVTVGATLYGLSPDGSGIYRYSGAGTSWTRVGSPAREMLRCGAMLCATNPDTLDLYRLESDGWQHIGDAAADYASTSTDLYRLVLDRSLVQKYSGSGTTWTDVGGPASAVYATTTTLFATSPHTGDLYRYDGVGTSWSVAGTPGRTFVGVGSTLYGLSPGREAIWRWAGSGTSWGYVGSPADWMYGGDSGSLYATNPDSKDIFRYAEEEPAWHRVGQP
jgi:hypothetical protein